MSNTPLIEVKNWVCWSSESGIRHGEVQYIKTRAGLCDELHTSNGIVPVDQVLEMRSMVKFSVNNGKTKE